MSDKGSKAGAKKTFVVGAIVAGKLIAEKDITFTDERGTGFQGTAFAIAMLKTEQRLRDELVSFKWTEKK